MAILITIPGTGDDDPNLWGSHRWWQANSAFMQRLIALLPDFQGEFLGKDGKSYRRVLPRRWSTANSEAERQRAANNLYEFLEHIDTHYPEEGIHIIAHSHGGNVVLEALLISIRRRRPLATLRSWTTIATPFFEYKLRNPLRNWMLRGLAAAALAAVLLIVLYGLFAITWQIATRTGIVPKLHNDWTTVSSAFNGLKNDFEKQFIYVDQLRSAPTGGVGTIANAISWGVFLIVCLPALFQVLQGIFSSYKNIRRWWKNRVEFRTRELYIRTYQQYSEIWRNIYADKDEAISALSSLDASTIDIIPRVDSGFIRNIVRTIESAFALFISAIALILLAVPWLRVWLEHVQAMSPPRWLHGQESTLFIEYIINLTGAFAFAAFVLLVILVHAPVRRIGRWAYFGLIDFINRQVFWKQIRKRSLGDDRDLEAIIRASSTPYEFHYKKWRSLPDTFVDMLLSDADKELQKTVGMLRRALAVLSSVGASFDLLRLLQSETTFKELLHTSYITTPTVYNIVAVGIAEADTQLKRAWDHSDEVMIEATKIFSAIRPGVSTPSRPLVEVKEKNSARWAVRLFNRVRPHS